MAKIAGSKTTKAAEAASLKKSRTHHRPSLGQLLVQPNAHADRENAKRVLAEALAAEEQSAINFIKAEETPAAPVATRPTRPVAGYLATFQGHEVRCGDGFITEAQAKWIVDLLMTRELSLDVEATFTRLEQGLAKFAGSQFITNHKNAPRKAAPVAKPDYAGQPSFTPAAPVAEVTEEVPAGRYAVRGEDGVVKFYKLDRPTEGRWAGYVFLKVQASDDLHSIRNRGERDRILAEIGKDILGAELLYGQELGKCSRCGRTLTREDSRAYGMGDDCRNK